MSLINGFDFRYDDLDFKGYSVAGQTTSLVFKNPKICFDIAQGLPFHMNSKLYCISHLHADHGAGLNYLLSQRSLFGLPEANIMLPKKNLDSVHNILTEWKKIEGFEYSYNLIGVEEGTSFDFSDQYVVRSFPTTHRVTSFGYIVYEKKLKLKKEFLELPPHKIVELRNSGTPVQEPVEAPLVAFTGDTQIEFLKAHKDVVKAKILFMECTYLDDKKDISQAREWGHIHLDEIIENLDLFHNSKVCLIHLSARYSTPQALKILDEKIDAKHRTRFCLFPRPF